jgi:DNA-binding NarL/FixJ family response regulator
MALPSLRSIVLVEDDPDMRLLMRLCLRPDPRIRIDAQATNALDAIALVGALEPDLIVLDHGLDGKPNGLEAAPALKRSAPCSLVLLCSMIDLAGDARAEPTIDGFLPKDHIRELLPTVQRMLGLAPSGEGC